MENIHPWESAYNKETFEIKTNKPSVIIEKYRDKFQIGDKVLDIGCGNGRNSRFLASLGCEVDCFDVKNLNWTENLSEGLRNKIHFSKEDINSFDYKKEKYKSIILARIIQYLSEEELKNLISKLHLSLTNTGFILMSFTSSGGIFDRKEIEVPKYQYTIEQVKNLLSEKFEKVLVFEGSNKSQNVNYSEEAKTYDIFIADKK